MLDSSAGGSSIFLAEPLIAQFSIAVSGERLARCNRISEEESSVVRRESLIGTELPTNIVWLYCFARNWALSSSIINRNVLLLLNRHQYIVPLAASSVVCRLPFRSSSYSTVLQVTNEDIKIRLETLKTRISTKSRARTDGEKTSQHKQRRGTTSTRSCAAQSLVVYRSLDYLHLPCQFHKAMHPT